jgi:phosphoribosylformylglycinamidine synthase
MTFLAVVFGLDVTTECLRSDTITGPFVAENTAHMPWTIFGNPRCGQPSDIVRQLAASVTRSEPGAGEGNDEGNRHRMKARIYVTLKPSVLDPQGKAIHHAVETIGYRGIEDVRQGKYFVVTIDGALSPNEARAEIERMARDVLANPIIEDFRVELDSDS